MDSRRNESFYRARRKSSGHQPSTRGAAVPEEQQSSRDPHGGWKRRCEIRNSYSKRTAKESQMITELDQEDGVGSADLWIRGGVGV